MIMTRFVKTKLIAPIEIEQLRHDHQPNVDPKFIEWYNENKDVVVKIHEEIDYASYRKIFILEFINVEEALLFHLRFP